uniref:DB domain-containing protein n=1 Tax=Strongyloides papillosus TaxID=174720 RepID=A0A0N5CDB9_STREA
MKNNFSLSIFLFFILIIFVTSYRDIRRAPTKNDKEGKCGTRESNWRPCISKNVANKLFKACCNQFVPKSCHSLCTYDTDHVSARRRLIDIVMEKKCSLEYLSSIMFCASQNRDNRKCCIDLGLNNSDLMVGSRCLRFCDPYGTQIDKITKEDSVCWYNLNVINFCHHSGIKEM